MEILNLCKEVLENAIGVYKTCAECAEEPLAPLEAVSVQAMEELLKYKALEEQGLLLRLPCKVGDTIYKIPSKVNYELNNMHHHPELNRVYEQIVYSVEMFNNDRYFIRTCDGIDGVVSDLYKETWFITREEAEAALQKMKGEEHEV